MITTGLLIYQETDDRTQSPTTTMGQWMLVPRMIYGKEELPLRGRRRSVDIILRTGREALPADALTTT